MTTINKALDLANYVIWKASRMDKPLKHSQIRVIVFYVLCRYYRETDELLFDYPVQKAMYGPLVEEFSVYFRTLFFDHRYRQPMVYPIGKSKTSEFGYEYRDTEAVCCEMDKNERLKNIVVETINDLYPLNFFEILEKIIFEEPSWQDVKNVPNRGNLNIFYKPSELKQSDYRKIKNWELLMQKAEKEAKEKHWLDDYTETNEKQPPKDGRWFWYYDATTGLRDVAKWDDDFEEYVVGAESVGINLTKWKIYDDKQKPKAGSWVSIKDELPNTGDLVLTYNCVEVNIDRVVSKYSNGEPVFDSGDDVTHWQPLPQPPKGDE